MLIVAIDPGHGGPDDRGTLDAGFVEAEYVMRFGGYLAARLESSGAPVRTALTRCRDMSVGLEARGRIAHANAADLALSVHVNAGPPTLRGAMAFCWPGDARGRLVAEAFAAAVPPGLQRHASSVVEATGGYDPDHRWLQRPRAVMWPHARRGRSVVLLELGYRTHHRDRTMLLDQGVIWSLAIACEAGISRLA